MLPKSFRKLLINPMLDLEQALSFEFYYHPKLGTTGYQQISPLKKGLWFYPAQMMKLAQVSGSDGKPTSVSQHV